MDNRIARYLLSPVLGGSVRSYLARPFSRKAERRVVFYYTPNRISYSQAYPFLHYEPDFHRRFGCEIRAVPIDRLLSGEGPVHERADLILYQPWFQVDHGNLARSLDVLQRKSPDAPIAFLDSYAHSDVRLGKQVDGSVRHYVKKSLFRDRAQYCRTWAGGTNLTDYYGRLFACEAEEINWQTPANLVEKLRLGPNFFTDARFLNAFLDRPMPSRSGRVIDLHSRLGELGTDWYSSMRRAATAALASMGDLRIVSDSKVPMKHYMQELKQSKLCFSPFGYGELCWRDIEAILCGAALIKPSMDHLETLPDLFEAGVTYLPVRWDFADLEEVVRGALANPDLCDRIADEAWRRVSDYLRSSRFVDDVAFLF